MAGPEETGADSSPPYQKDNRSEICMIRGRAIVLRGLETEIFLCGGCALSALCALIPPKGGESVLIVRSGSGCGLKGDDEKCQGAEG
jgi:hypothetical protein